ncbi:hypothetical protein GDO86_009190 [Hymenochirus boettgeri]|uniref:PBZ-type domain-containing protein n=1 Tax=Hymenochirus boettgeri TaxID=247094 RepID=A0A8T2JK83_9PIPI|nr:hypothetical protein GDO86_009190 [Hymenochirus boettgeri]
MNTNATLEDCAVLPGTSSYSLQIGSVDKKSNTEDKNEDVEDLVQNNQNDSRASQDYERNKSNENVQRIQSTGSSSVMHSKASTSQTASSNMQSLISKDESFCEISGDNHGGDQAAKKRTSCIYGEKCYRKNPAHFEEFCHPGDSDYVNTENESQDDSDDRPECPYGTDCYRKNPQHKLEYKHTMPPGRKLRRRAPKKVQSVLDDDSDNDGEPNAYDFEDSFINDEEEEDFDNTDEDSDWMPNSEEKDSEDVTNLLKEAKKFMKSKH